jgi:hypothetical protein
MLDMERFYVKKMTVCRLKNSAKSKSQTDLLFWKNVDANVDISRAGRSVSDNTGTSAKVIVGSYGQTLL